MFELKTFHAKQHHKGYAPTIQQIDYCAAEVPFIAVELVG